MPPDEPNIFISYNRADRSWAEWIAWQLEAAGESVVIQAWDFLAGTDFVLEMDRAARETMQTIAILSPSYLEADYTHPEWAAAFARDPRGRQRSLLPVRVEHCEPEGLLAQRIWVDLVGACEEEARRRLLAAVTGDRAKPQNAPGFPGESPDFPGAETAGEFSPPSTAAAATAASPGADLRYDLNVSFKEAAFGKDVELVIPRLETCDSCRGFGQRGNVPEACGMCSGTGKVHVEKIFSRGFKICPNCRGVGLALTDPCKQCGGDGRVKMKRNIKVTIPPGVDNDVRLRLRSEGEHGLRGGSTGDLDVVIAIRPHKKWQREGYDVHEKVRCTYGQLLKGTPVEIETLHGKEQFHIPAKTSPGQEFRLLEKGVQKLDGNGRGDHIVRVELEFPRE